MQKTDLPSHPGTRSFVVRVQAPKGWHDMPRRVRVEDVSREQTHHFKSLTDAFSAIRQALNETETPPASSSKPH